MIGYLAIVRKQTTMYLLHLNRVWLHMAQPIAIALIWGNADIFYTVCCTSPPGTEQKLVFAPSRAASTSGELDIGDRSCAINGSTCSLA